MKNQAWLYALGALILVLPPADLRAQAARPWAVSGDTSGAPSGCSAKAAIEAIGLWFTSYNSADSVGLAAATASRFVFSTGKHWTLNDSPRRIDHSLSDLLAYVRDRRTHGEFLRLTQVTFYGWRGARLGFMPYYTRSADDLGAKPIPGLGKAEYWCRLGIRVLNLAPKNQVLRSPSNREL
jgi:hypothetical protein